jgi:RNA polymerase-binding transcription factor DksA
MMNLAGSTFASPFSWGKKPMDDHRTRLQRELEEVQRQITALEVATETKPDYGLGEGDPAITRWEMDTVLLAQLREKAETLKTAMSGTDQDKYGICEQCGNQIHPDRLAVLPDTRLCINCARRS